MQNDNITANFMVRNEEHTIGWAILAVAPFVKTVLVYDTGSEDKTIDIVHWCQKIYKNIRLEHIKGTLDQTFWTQNPDYPPSPNPPCKKLANVRNIMAQDTETDWILQIDGDEIWHSSGIKDLFKFHQTLDKDVDAVYVPLIWLAEDAHTQCRLAKPQVYPCTGRLFNKKDFFVWNHFPGEVAMYRGILACPARSGVKVLEFRTTHPMFHYEVTFKPWRRKVMWRMDLPSPYPDVLDKYPQILDIKNPNLASPSQNLPRGPVSRNLETLMPSPLLAISHPIGRCQNCGVTGPLFSRKDPLQRICIGCVGKEDEQETRK